MRVMQILLTTIVIGIAFMIGACMFLAHNRCIDFSALERYDPGKPSLLLDDEGNEWARFQLDRRKPIAYKDVPPHLINAFLAIEDRTFFEHSGVSYKGIIRSVLVNVYHRRVVQGASTITQQLVKLLFTDSQRTFMRKIKDQLYALLVERHFTKEQILETYLNHVFFGCGIYGVEAAAQRFWKKTTKELSLDECATLAGIVKNPGRYCPILFPLTSQGRRNVVLDKMCEMGAVTQEEKNSAQEIEMTLQEYNPSMIAPHLKETIRQFLEPIVGKQQLYSGGLRIQTTLSSGLQKKAECAFIEQMNALKEKISPKMEGALISCEVKTGEIKAIVGGYDFKTSKFNRAMQAKRQFGSVFKTLVYAAAIEKGVRFNEVEIDEPVELSVGGGNYWRPRNYNRQFAGSMTLAYALSRSNNMVPIKLFMRIGADAVVDLAKRCCIPDAALYSYPSLALGCVDVTPQEAVATFNVFANNGVWVQPHCIRWVKDVWGNKLYKHIPKQNRAMSAYVSGQVTKVLSIGLQRVRKLFPQKWPDAQAISKTGTTNDSRTCWFAGSTPELTTVVYVGCDDNRSMGNNVYPLRTAFPIWIGVHRDIQYHQKQFVYDPMLKELLIDEKTGELATDSTKPGVISIYI